MLDFWRPIAAQVGRGILMGGADIVPGVSGGTVALILGIYERLVTAISHVDAHLIGLLARRQWRAAAEHVDLIFLVPLLVGIGSGFVIMTTLVNYLFSDPWTRSLTLATFFGLILASGVLVASMIEARTAGQRACFVVLSLAGALFALWVAGLTGTTTSEPGLLYLFGCGAVAICAMILPGISGAMMLLVLGVYLHLTEIPRNLIHGEQVGVGLVQAAVFASGCGLGLLAFSRVLRWLLTHQHGPTVAVLCGFMFGSLRKLWPFQVDVTPWIEKVKYKQFQSVLPSQLDAQFFTVVAVVGGAAAAVLAIEWVCRGRLKRHPVDRPVPPR